MADKLTLNEDLFESFGRPDSWNNEMDNDFIVDLGDRDDVCASFEDAVKSANKNNVDVITEQPPYSTKIIRKWVRGVDGRFKVSAHDESIKEGWESIDGLKFTRTGVHGEKLDDYWIDYGDYLVNKNRLQDEMLRDFKEENGYTRADEDREEFWNEFDKFIAERGLEYLNKTVNESLKEDNESRIIRITDIDWDTDGEDVDLPTEVKISMNTVKDWMMRLNHYTDEEVISELDEDIADYLSNKYGWLVNGFYYDERNVLNKIKKLGVFIFDESLDEDLFLAPQEPSDETPATAEANGVAKLILDAINDESDTIKMYNDLIANTDNEDIIKIIQDITAEENNHLGMLQKALEIVSPNASNIDDGMEEAESMIEEPVANAEPDFVPVSESLNEELGREDKHTLIEYNQQIQDKISDMLYIFDHNEYSKAYKDIVKASFLISEAVDECLGDEDIDESLNEKKINEPRSAHYKNCDIVKDLQDKFWEIKYRGKQTIKDGFKSFMDAKAWIDDNLISGKLNQSLVTEDVTKEWKPDTSFKHIKKVLDTAKKRGKYVNNEREEVLAAIDKADKNGYTAEQRKFIRDSHAEMWKKNRSVTEDIHDKFKRDIKTAYKKWASDVERVESKRKEAMDMIPDNASKEQISQYTDFVNNKIYPMVSDFDYEFPHNIEKGDFPFYVTYYSEYPIYEPAEGGYYYAGRDAVWSQGFNSEEEARQFLNDFIVEDGEDWEQDQDGRYTVHGKYIGQDQTIKLEPNQDYLSAIAGWHPYE